MIAWVGVPTVIAGCVGEVKINGGAKEAPHWQQNGQFCVAAVRLMSAGGSRVADLLFRVLKLY